MKLPLNLFLSVNVSENRHNMHKATVKKRW